ncbi:mucin-2-like [Patiria miniata]|uniref:Apple domain-containing protein n=1 Tax=Patiria miniata TaxID=46514 RepID=A0A914ABR7_PATMI|nr:mucin-2-like [Patiria miniata]
MDGKIGRCFALIIGILVTCSFSIGGRQHRQHLFTTQESTRLAGSAFSEKSAVGSAVRCSALCAKHSRCVSFNYAKVLGLCELNRNTSRSLPGNLEADARFKYYEIMNQVSEIRPTEGTQTTTTQEPTTEEPTTTQEPTTDEEPTTTTQEPITDEEPTATTQELTTDEEPTTTTEETTTDEEPTTTTTQETTTDEEPTTKLEPTTTEPTTAVTTSQGLTTLKPSTTTTQEVTPTNEPTTMVPTTQEQTTKEPTTVVTSSQESATLEPTTTTQEPMPTKEPTMMYTAQEPTTKEPITTMPTTQEPSSKKLTTEVPTTQSLTTAIVTDPILWSCSALRDNGYIFDGYYMIDPDGADGEEAFQVFCSEMTTVGWTTVDHPDSNLDIAVTSDPFDVTIAYYANKDQIQALIGVSTTCRQYLSADCRNAHLWMGKTRLAWWVAEDGAKMDNWAGAATGTKGCSCSGSCAGGNSEHRCNCGAVADQWYSDGGFIVDEARLPVKALHFDNAAPPNHQLYYNLGGLQCAKMSLSSNG